MMIGLEIIEELIHISLELFGCLVVTKRRAPAWELITISARRRYFLLLLLHSANANAKCYNSAAKTAETEETGRQVRFMAAGVVTLVVVQAESYCFAFFYSRYRILLTSCVLCVPKKISSLDK